MKTNVYYDSLDVFYKSVSGAVKENTEITFRVESFDSVVFVYEKDGENVIREIPMQSLDGYCECTATFARGLYRYWFKLPDGRYIVECDGFSEISSVCEGKFQLTAYAEDFSVPEWLQGGIIYQIFPDRFNSSGENIKPIENRIIHENLSDTPYFLPDENGKVLNNDFFGGDLKGIMQKMPYLKDLGVTAIYLNPIFQAYSNHRYDTGDYLKTDPFLGNEDDFKNFISTANENGIKIILDGVFNHTGDDSVYFNKYGRYDGVGAYQSKNSPYYNWFKFINYPDLYESWWGIDVLPATNKDNAEFINFITGENGVLSRYVKLGIGGWRLDVVDELPPHFVKAIRDRVKKDNPNAIIIGEVWEDASNKISYGVRREYFQGKELDSVMNYPLKNAILHYVKHGDERILLKIVREQIDRYPEAVLHSLMNILATHDTFRLLSALGDVDVDGLNKSEMSKTSLNGKEYERAKNKLKSAVLLQYTLYGVPSVYYGDEIGMQGYSDPLNRKYFDWEHIDNEIREHYVKLGALRRDYSCFKKGKTQIVYSANGCFVFKRYDEDSEVLIAVNCGEKTAVIGFDGYLFEYLSKKEYLNEITLSSGECGIFLKKLS